MEYRILGPLEVDRDGVTVDVGGPRQRALLARLLIAGGRVVSVDRLVDDLWGDEPPAAAIGILQSYVSNLRRALEPDRAARAPATRLLTRPPGYVLELRPGELDAAVFEARVAEGRAAAEAGDPAAAETLLTGALALWRGEALADFATEAFAVAEASRLDELRRAAEEDRVDAVLAAGRAGTAVAELEGLVAESPLRERRRAQLMVALYRTGRQADALRVYRQGRTLLVDELGLEPGPELQRLEDLVLRQSPELDWQPRAGARTTEPGGSEEAETGPGPEAVQAAPAGLVGRDREIATLDAALDAARAHRGQVVLVEGEAGIGKTRLTEEVEARARGLGAVVLEGRGYEGEGTPPYWPWLQALRPLFTSVPADLLATAAAPSAADLAPLLPEIKEIVPGVEAPASTDAGTARFRLADAITGLLVRVSSHAPIVLVLDDLHWSDPASLFVLRFLAGGVRTASVLVVATYRPDEANAQLAETLAALAREPTLMRVSLAGLTADHVAHVLTERLGHAVDDDLVTAVQGRTGGNPFFIQEVARSLSEPGAAADGLARVPAGVRAVLERRLDALADPTRRLLELAAVAGRGVELRLLNAVVGDALEDLEPALVERILVPVSGTLSRLRFVHDLWRETVLDTIPPVRRARLHGDVAVALAGLGDGQVDELAEHYWAAADAGYADRAFDAAIEAADHGIRLLAFESTQEHLARAQALLERFPVGAGLGAERELAVSARTAALRQRIYGVTAPETGEAVTRVRRMVEAAGLSREVVSGVFLEWGFYVVRAELERGLEIAEELLAHGEATGDPAFLAAGGIAVGNTCFHLGDLERSRAALELAVAAADTAPGLATVVSVDPSAVARSFQAPLFETLGDSDRATRVVAEAGALTARAGAEWDSAHVHFCGAWAAAVAGDPDRATREAIATAEIARVHSLAFYLAPAEFFHGWAMVVGGDPAGEDQMRAGLDGFHANGGRLMEPLFRGLAADAAAALGRPDDALALIDEGLAVAVEQLEPWYDPELHRRRGELLAAAGDGDGAVASLRRAVERAVELGAGGFERRARESANAAGLSVAS